MKNLALVFILILPCISFAGDNQLHLSESLQVNYDVPRSLIHSGSLLIFNYDDWFFSHELVDAVNYHYPIDLTDVEVDFFKSLFLIEKRNELPEWLGLVSFELSNSFGIKADKIDSKMINEASLFGSYSEEYKQGNIFIMERSQVHHININGFEEKYQSVFNSIVSK